jgi:hypothetical protein
MDGWSGLARRRSGEPRRRRFSQMPGGAPGRRRLCLAGLVALLVGVAAPPASADLLAPTNLRITPGVEALGLRWGVNTAEGLGEFRVRWRPISPVALPWSPVVSVGPGRRGYTIAHLGAQPYEVIVRAVTAEGKIAGSVKEIGTPLLGLPLPEEPPVSLKVGLDTGGWLLTNDLALNIGKLKLLRGENMSTERLASYEAAGWKMIDLIGHNPATNVSPETLASEAVARAKAHPAIVATEILNEPQNPYAGGSESQANIEAYARIVNAVAKRLHESTASVPLWSADGGYAGVPSWGAKVWPLLDANAKAIGRPTTHPYGGTNSRERSALGGRSRVEEAFALTKERGWTTEVGWPTAVGQPATGDSLQWTEAEQARNIESFIRWAQPYDEAVVVFQYRDYGTNNFYGIETSGGLHKLSFAALETLAGGVL